MSLARLSYHPDEWAHDRNQWWAPLASLAGCGDCASDDWLTVLGVEEFFDHGLLGQPHILTPWVCLAAAAAAASAAHRWAEIARQPDAGGGPETAARAVAVAAFELAVSLQRFRWSGQRVGVGVISTTELIEVGQAALRAHGFGGTTGGMPTVVHLVAGWLSHSGGEVRVPDLDGGGPVPEWHKDSPAQQGAMYIVASATGADVLTWGTAHLVERLAGGALDSLGDPQRPDHPPAAARANVLFVSGQGEVGVFEARRQISLLEVPTHMAVPDLARLAFARAKDDFLGSVADAFAAAQAVEPLGRPGELVSWSLRLPAGRHPLSERAVSGRSAGLGAYADVPVPGEHRRLCRGGRGIHGPGFQGRDARRGRRREQQDRGCCRSPDPLGHPPDRPGVGRPRGGCPAAGSGRGRGRRHRRGPAAARLAYLS